MSKWKIYQTDEQRWEIARLDAEIAHRKLERKRLIRNATRRMERAQKREKINDPHPR